MDHIPEKYHEGTIFPLRKDLIQTYRIEIFIDEVNEELMSLYMDGIELLKRSSFKITEDFNSPHIWCAFLNLFSHNKIFSHFLLRNIPLIDISECGKFSGLDELKSIDPLLNLSIEPRVKIYSRSLRINGELPYFKMGFSYTPRWRGHILIYIGDFDNTRMFREDVEFIFYLNYWRFYKSYADFIPDKDKLTSKNEVYLLYNRVDDDEIDKEAEKDIKQTRKFTKITEYDYVWGILTHYKVFRSYRMDGASEKDIAKATAQSIINTYKKLKNMFCKKGPKDEEDVGLGKKRKYDKIERDIDENRSAGISKYN